MGLPAGFFTRCTGIFCFATGFADTIFSTFVLPALLSALEFALATGFLVDDLIAEIPTVCFTGFFFDTTSLRTDTVEDFLFWPADLEDFCGGTFDFAVDFLAGLARRDFFLAGDFMRQQIVRMRRGVVRNHPVASLGRCLPASNGFCQTPFMNQYPAIISAIGCDGGAALHLVPKRRQRRQFVFFGQPIGKKQARVNARQVTEASPQARMNRHQ